MNQGKRQYFLLINLLLLVFGCAKNDDIVERDIVVPPKKTPVLNTELVLRLNHVADKTPLKLGGNYTNEWGETFTVDVFKYYLSNIVLIYDTTTIYLPETYFLIDQERDESRNISLPNIPKGKLIGVEMLIGVDATRNFSGAQIGALDPILGMFWTWKSGYIMAKIEGNYTKPNNQKALYIWHCGGYEPPYTSLRKVRLAIEPTAINSITQTTITIDGNILEWFKTPHKVTLNSIPVFNDPSAIAVQVADNYSDMFSIQKVEQTPF